MARGERGQYKLYQAGARWGQREAGQSSPRGHSSPPLASLDPPVLATSTDIAPDLVKDCRLSALLEGADNSSPK